MAILKKLFFWKKKSILGSLSSWVYFLFFPEVQPAPVPYLEPLRFVGSTSGSFYAAGRRRRRKPPCRPEAQRPTPLVVQLRPEPSLPPSSQPTEPKSMDASSSSPNPYRRRRPRVWGQVHGPRYRVPIPAPHQSSPPPWRSAWADAWFYIWRSAGSRCPTGGRGIVLLWLRYW